MAVSAFQQGSQVEIDGKTYCLTRKVTDEIWQLEESRTKRIHEISDAQLRILYSRGQLRFIDHRLPTPVAAHRAGIPHREIADEAWELAKVRRAYVLEVLELPSTKSKVVPVIQKLWETLQQPAKAPSASSVLDWKRDYLAAGKDIHALIDNTDKKGNRRPRYPTDVTEIVEAAVERLYLSRERRTVQDTLHNAMHMINEENRLRPSVLQLPVPSRRLVQRVINQIPAMDRAIARHGKTAATKLFRGVLGHRITEAPLERVEMDHTKLDLFVVEDNSGVPLGRPWVTACIDDYTRCVLGIHVGFEPPSYLTVAHCLKHALMPKSDLKQQYKNIENDWEAHGVMRALVVDNGMEFHSRSLENACFSLGIEVHYAPHKTPWFKGKIERFFGTLNHNVAHGNPGTTFSNIFEKDDYDPSKHAVVSLALLQEIIRKWIVDCYHQQPHRTLQAPPAEVWRTSIAPEDILLPSDPASLNAVMGRTEERTLTHKGIELDGLLYNSPELVKLRQRLGSTLRVELRIDDTDLGQITVLSPDKTQMYPATALNQAYAKGLTRWQHAVYKRHASRRLLEHDPSGWLKAKEEIRLLIEEDLANRNRRTRSKVARHLAQGNGEIPVTPEANPPIEVEVSETSGVAFDVNTTVPAPADPTEAPAEVANSDTSAAPRRRFQPIFRDRSKGDGQSFLEDESNE